MANGDGDLKVVDSQPLPDLSVVSSGAIPPESMMHRWWRGLTTPLPRTPGSDEEAVREGSGPALTGLSTIGLAGVPIEAIAARSLAPLAPLVKGAIGSAAGSWLGGKAGSVIGQEKAGSTIGGLAGALYGGSGGKIPTNMAELETVMQSPEAKARAAQEVEGQETLNATQMQDAYNRRIAREQVAADRAAQKAATTPQATPAKPIPKGTNYGTYLADQKAAAKAAAAQPASPIVTAQSADIPSEGRPATWRNLSVSDLASKGGPLTFDAAKQAQLRQLDVPNVGLVADPRATVGGAGLGSSADRLARLREIAAPALRGGPGDFTSQAAEPQWAYRTRDVGEAGVPADARSPAHATSSFEQAQRFAESRNPGKPQEIVRFNTNSLKPGELSAQPFSDSVDWYRLHRPLTESEVEVVQPAEQESE